MKKTPSRQQIVALVLAAFFVSGFTGLVYEILWVRTLTKYVGGSTFSVTLVLTVFMAGLALGSWLAGRFVDKIRDTRDLVRLYAVIEIAIGLYAGLFPFMLKAFSPLYALLYRGFGHSLILYGSVSGTLSIALLILPTTLMGATLPILSRYYIDAVSRAGTKTGLLYGINTIGAALGSLICGVVLLRWLGSQTTLTAAVAANVIIGLGFLALIGLGSSEQTGFLRSAIDALRENLKVPPVRFSRRSVVIMLAVSGACSMAYEVIWTKLLALLVGPTTYSFTLVLFTFITGLALGSLLFGWICDRVKNPIALLIGTQLAAAGAALACSHFLGNSQVFFAKLLYSCRESLLLLEIVKGTTVFLAMLPTTIFLGAIFPISTRIETERVENVGAIVGRLYMFNTVGAVVGSVSAGFLLVPLFGKSSSLSLLAFLQATVATLVVFLSAFRKRETGIGLAFCGVAILCLSLGFPKWDTYSLVKGKYHRFDDFSDRLQSMSFAETVRSPEKLTAGLADTDEIVFFKDGIGGFISVAETVNSLGVTNVFLQISGKTDASSQNDLHTMTLTGQIPMLLHPNAKRGMVVGLASGITAGEMLHYPMELLDVIEISPEVVEACRYFDRWNNGVLDDPRANVILQDARTHIALTDQIYDVIVSEPSNPWMAGVANLFTVEYFQSVRDHLAPDGIFVQWYHAYQTDWESFCLVGRTLTEVFPNNCIIKTSTTGSDYLMVAFADEKPLSDYLANIEAAMPVAAKSQNMRFLTPHVLDPLILAENPSELYGTGPLHTDRQPLLEFTSLQQFYSGRTDILENIIRGSRISPQVGERMQDLSNPLRRLDFAEFMASVNVEPFGLAGLQKDAKPKYQERADAIIEAYASANLAVYGRILDEREKAVCMQVHESMINNYLQKATRTRAPLQHIGLAHFDLGNICASRHSWDAAIDCFTRASLLMPTHEPALKNLARCYERKRDYETVAPIYERLIELDPRSPRLFAKLATAHLHIGSLSYARTLFEQALQMDAAYAPALTAIGSLDLRDGRVQQAISSLQAALDADPQTLRAYQNLIVAHFQAGQPSQARHYLHEGLRRYPNDPTLLKVLYDVEVPE
jgi:spermidine synthase